MKVNELSQAAQNFLNEIRAQLDGLAVQAFDNVLFELGKPGHDEAEQLRFLRCLLDAGVDNWEGYDEALTDFNGEESEENEDD